MFDNNPRVTSADKLIAGNTVETIVRTVAAADLGAKITRIGAVTVTTEGASRDEIILALVARFDRKADRKAASAEAE